MSSNDNGIERGLADLLKARFGEEPRVPEHLSDNAILLTMAAHRTIRKYEDRAVDEETLRTVCSVGLSAPSKSDLQQADVLWVSDADKQAEIGGLIPSMPWIATAPALLVVCGNNRRQRKIANLHGEPFPNDHLDPFFNAAVDAGLVLAWLIVAAQAAGLGCCPISVLRNHSSQISDILGLPDHVFPIAGLTMGYAAETRGISPRLDLSLTLHRNRHSEEKFEDDLSAYDDRREEVHRGFGQEDFRWSRAKAKQYSTLQRGDFGAFIRSKGFKLD